MKKLAHIIGTRPQYIKLFPLWHEINNHTEFQQTIYDTGQHYDVNMSRKLVEEFEFTGIDSGDMKNLEPKDQFPKMTGNIWEKLSSYSPDYAFIYGDTNSTLAAAIVCAKLEIPFGHIEAGVRTEPNVGIQEGINRIVADNLSTHNFCATLHDSLNLKSEGKKDDNVFYIGDLMSDAFHKVSNYKKSENEELVNQPTLLITIHRSENVDNHLICKKILQTISHLSNNFRIIFPIHPRLRSKIDSQDLEQLQKKGVDIRLPFTYSEVVSILNQVVGVVTDSGGLPKDAAYAGVKSVVLRSDPIWTDLKQLGYINTIENLQNKSASELASEISLGFKGKLAPYVSKPAVKSVLTIVASYLNAKN